MKAAGNTASSGLGLTARTGAVAAAVGVALALFACSDPATPEVQPMPDEPPDIVFHNGQVLTMEPSSPVSQAVAIRSDRILEVGHDALVLNLATDETRLVDLGGRTLLPGFVDAHNHTFHSTFFQTEADIIGTTYDEAQQAMLAVGITAHGNPGGFPEFTAAFVEYAASGGLRVRASLYLQPNDYCGGTFPSGWYADFQPITDGNALFRVPGVKIFSDGGGCAQPALSLPESTPWGDIFMPAEELARLIREAHAAGFQVAIHALGDRALDTVFVALEAALADIPAPHPPRIEHNRIARPDQWSRYAEFGAIPVVFGQPFTCPIIDGGAWSALQNDDHWVAVARPWFDPWRSIINANPGYPVAWHSDFRFFAFEPLTHVWSLVTRREARDDGSICEPPEWLRENALGVEDALRLMTTGAAHALLMEDYVGSIRPGKLADLIILSGNPLAVAPDDIRHIEVLMTMVGGQVEHCRSGHAGLCPD